MMSDRTIETSNGIAVMDESADAGKPARRINGDAVADDRHARSRRERAKDSLDERLGRPTPTVWLSGAEAAEYVGVSWPTLRQLILDDAVPHVRLGTRWKIAVEVLDTHLQRRAEMQVGAH